jgi:hypothetical protein
MAKRTVKHAKRSSRKTGGRKAKKGSRKTQRRMRGGYFFGRDTSKIIDWSNSFEANRQASSAGGMVYHMTWSAGEQKLVLDFKQLGRLLQGFAGIKNKLASLMGLVAPGIDAKLDAATSVIGPITGSDYGGWSRSNVLEFVIANGNVVSLTLKNSEDASINVNLLEGLTVNPTAWSAIQAEYLKLYQDGVLVITSSGTGSLDRVGLSRPGLARPPADPNQF